jgi:phospholipid/cholesterol/gamma-HCH transport system substrate-binding protein
MNRTQKIRVLAICTLCAAGIIFWFTPRSQERKLNLTACFEDVRGLRPGARVRIAGVEVGNAASVEAHPERKDCKAEVLMSLRTPYGLKVPADSVARVESEGVLGPAFVDIDVRNTMSPPIGNHGQLKTMVTPSTLEAIKAAVDAASAQCSDCRSKQQRSAPANKR